MTDFMGMMKQAAQLQSKMQAVQAELDTITVEGTDSLDWSKRESHAAEAEVQPAG